MENTETENAGGITDIEKIEAGIAGEDTLFYPKHWVRARGGATGRNRFHLPAEESSMSDARPLCDYHIGTWKGCDPLAYPPSYVKGAGICAECRSIGRVHGGLRE